MNMNTQLAVQPLDQLAQNINDNHAMVKDLAHDMLNYAKNAGDALIEAKASVAHGEFKPWVADNCICSYVTATKYMNVARNPKGFDRETFEGSIDAFLGYSKSTTAATTPKPSFDTDDAVHAQKLHTLATRGATEGERDAAQRKLDTFAGTFGMTGEEAAGRAEVLTDFAEEEARVDAGLAQFTDKLQLRDKTYLIKVIMNCFFHNPELIKKVL